MLLPFIFLYYILPWHFYRPQGEGNAFTGSIPASSSHSQPMGHFSVEWWNNGILPLKAMERPGAVRPVAV